MIALLNFVITIVVGLLGLWMTKQYLLATTRWQMDAVDNKPDMYYMYWKYPDDITLLKYLGASEIAWAMYAGTYPIHFNDSTIPCKHVIGAAIERAEIVRALPTWRPYADLVTRVWARSSSLFLEDTFLPMYGPMQFDMWNQASLGNIAEVYVYVDSPRKRLIEEVLRVFVAKYCVKKRLEKRHGRVSW